MKTILPARNLIRVLVVLAGLAGLVACANPSDFKAQGLECPEGRFDIPSREGYCTGRVVEEETRFRDALVFEPGRPILATQRDGALILAGHSEGGAALAVVPVPEAGRGFSPAGYWKRKASDLRVTGLDQLSRPEALGFMDDKLFLVHDGGQLGVLRANRVLQAPTCVEDATSLPPIGGDDRVEDDEAAPPTQGSGGGETTPDPAEDEMGEGEVTVGEGEDTPSPICSDGVATQGPLAEGEGCPESDDDLSDALRSGLSQLAVGCGAPLSVRSLEPMELSFDGRPARFMLVTTSCGAAMVGRGGVDSFAPAYFMPLEGATDIKFDAQRQRLFVAAGQQGLRVRYTGSISQELRAYPGLGDDQGALRETLESDGEACVNGEQEEDFGSTGNNNAAPVGCSGEDGDCVGGNSDNDPEVPGGDGRGDLSEPPGEMVEVPEPIFDTDEAQAVIDPSLQEQINVTQVSFAQEQVFFINSASEESPSALVVARLTPANTLEDRKSLELPIDDFGVDQARYRLESLSETLLLIVREAEVSGVREVSAWVADVTPGAPPRVVFTVPTDGETLAVAARGSRVTMVQPVGLRTWTLTPPGP